MKHPVKTICFGCFSVQVGFIIAPKPETTLQEMLAMGLDKYLDDLIEISGRAAKEFSLEKVIYNDNGRLGNFYSGRPRVLKGLNGAEINYRVARNLGTC